MEATEAIEAKARALREQAGDTEIALDELCGIPLEDRMAELDAVEKARLLTTVAYAVSSLAFVCLKLNGVPPKTHPVKKELDRIKHYFEKIEAATPAGKAPMRIDQGAAKRFLHHTLAANPEIHDEIRQHQQEERQRQRQRQRQADQDAEDGGDKIVQDAAEFIKQLRAEVDSAEAGRATPPPPLKRTRSAGSGGSPPSNTDGGAVVGDGGAGKAVRANARQGGRAPKK
ncbi:hypothetical protein HK105_207726 [Polyrhizophydium stewartii]|uniref:Exosome complex protein n=1 Tax=Polyrhizophydium stewartii TaxID=2732419 RepID=A0ABR4MZS0_9FUNG